MPCNEGNIAIHTYWLISLFALIDMKIASANFQKGKNIM